MRTLIIDGDGCPDRNEIVDVAKKCDCPTYIFCDYNHRIEDDYSEVVYIDQGNDAVDMAIVKQCKKGDIVITQDYGLSALVLGKGAKVIHTSGRIVDNQNIDMLLMQRHMNSVARKKGMRSHHAKRTKEDTELLMHVIETMLKQI